MNPNNTITSSKIKEVSLSLLLEIGKLLDDSKQYDDVLNPTLMILADQFNLEDAAITIFDNKSKEIYIDASYGMSPIQRNRGRYQLGEGIIGEVVQSQTQIIVPQISNEPKFLNKAKDRASNRELSFICVPIKHRSEVTGTLSITLPYDYNNYLEGFADFITIISFLLLEPIILRRELALAKKQIQEHDTNRDKLYAEDMDTFICNSRTIKHIKSQIHKYSKEDSPLFIVGEHGTGKTFIANLIHNSSVKRNSSLVQCICSTMSPQQCKQILLGDLTTNNGSIQNNALSSEPPLIVQAINSTLLIEDLEMISLESQQMLLQLIQKQEILIKNTISKLSVRYVFTSTVPLEQLLLTNRIQQNLFDILTHNVLAIPPLRERKDDIMLFCDQFLQAINKQLHSQGALPLNKQAKRFSTPAIDLLTHYHWPGNLNELYKVIESAIFKSESGVIHAHTLPPSLQSADSTNTQNRTGLNEAIERLERDLIIDAFKSTNGHLSNAAQILGISDRILGLRIKKYKINPKTYR